MNTESAIHFIEKKESGNHRLPKKSPIEMARIQYRYLYGMSQTELDPWTLIDEDDARKTTKLAHKINRAANCGRGKIVLRHRESKDTIGLHRRCGTWICPICGLLFHDCWVSHVCKMMAGKAIYTLEIDKESWPRIHRTINNHQEDFLKVDHSARLVEDSMKRDRFTILTTDSSLRGATKIITNLEEFLSNIIPTQAEKRPISTSRGWDLKDNRPQESVWERVRSTNLSPEALDAAAERAGMEKVGYLYWIVPEGKDKDEVSKAFDKELRIEERNEEFRRTELEKWELGIT